ncbi:MAG: prenyltransferase [Candidatus Methanoperedens nitroreducens]|uniref:Prenyltransferase n=2 Tax=Candidatus Methanoperedens TaxID=1392997 RepID=A0A0P7ZGE5_9EURY|nr:MAG: prenyltransferase [Candidatus Methanoperedens sp. BLZ1]
MQKKALFIAVLLYACSLLFVYYLSYEFKRPIYLYALVCIIITWCYSDNLILKKVLGIRLKDHYLGELAAYSIAFPSYTLSIWLVYSDLNLKAIILTIAIFFFSISGLLLKDLKDISGDMKAGLKTFGVVFLPSQLVRYSCYFMVLFYLTLLNLIVLSSYGILVIMIPFIYFF